MIAPANLHEGDTIGIVAPSRAIDTEALKLSISLLQKQGYKVKIGSSIGLRDNQFAGSDFERAEDINAMFADSSVKAIWCARGGYGSVRTLQYVDLELVKRNPKWFIGYSDITVFHSALNTIGLQSIHATMPVNINTTSNFENIETLLACLNNEAQTYHITAHLNNQIGEVQAELVGGNLSVLYSLRGTPSDLDTDDKILFIEDLDEYLYHIDRMMMNLSYGSYLKKIKGLLVGGMTDMKDNTIPFGKNAEEIIAHYAKNLAIPVCFGFPAGHTEKNLALPFGKIVRLKVTKEGALLEL